MKRRYIFRATKRRISWKKVFLLIITCYVLVSGQYGTVADSDFTLGTFSFVSNKTDFISKCNQFNQHLIDLGYNTSLFELFPSVEGGDPSLIVLFNSLRDHNLKAAIWDADYLPGNRNSSYAYSTACYQRFEAEFYDWHAVQQDDLYNSAYWYGSRDVRVNNDYDSEWDIYHRRVGQQTEFITSSYNNVWSCYQDSVPNPGYAYADLKYRWVKTPYQDSTTDTLDMRIGKEFALKKLTQSPLGPETDQYLYISYCFKIDEVRNIPDTMHLLQFTVCGYPSEGNGHSKTPQFVDLYINGVSVGQDYNLSLADYNVLHSMDPFNEWVTLNVAVRYCDLWDKQLLIPKNWWRNTLVNINPIVYWFDNCDLFLDYIEIKDDLYNDIQSNAALYNTAIIDRINAVQNIQTSIDESNLVSHIFSFDEPYPPQFSPYRELERNLSLSLRPEKQFTAVNIRNFRQFPMGPNGTKDYNNVEAFTKVAQPNNLMLNPYPITPEIKWGSDVNDEDHIQKILDEFVLDNYAIAKTYADSLANREFYACVQAYGEWTDGHWSNYLLPPPETQKMMQYLPLCYGADGIFNFRLFGWEDNAGVDSYGALVCDLNLSNIYVKNLTYDALQTANQKVLTYGPILRELDWLGANTILDNTVSAPVDLALLRIDDICSASTIVNDYGCFVQSGYFKDDNQNPNFMLVNRRANYFDNTHGFASPNLVPYANYDDCFPAAESQLIQFTTNASIESVYGTYPALFDPFDLAVYLSIDSNITVPIEPGDGKMLRMCSSLPAEVAETCTIKKYGILSGNIVIQEGGNVTVEDGTDLTIVSGSQITITSGASFTFRGDITIEDGVTIKVEENGTACFNSAECKWGQGSALIVEAGTLEISGGSFASTNTADTRWTGISATNSSVVALNNCTISDALHNSVSNSFLSVTDVTFNVPVNSYGLIVKNDVEGYDTMISNTQDGRGFYGDANANCLGLALGIMRNTAIIHNVRFHNLMTGLVKVTNIGEQDSIAYCNFSSCQDGIKIFSSSYYGRIQNCVFNDNQTGIKLNAAIPYINNCSFVNNVVRGILSEYSIFTFGLENGIYNSNFNNNPIGLESRGSNHRIETSYFSNNVSALISHGGSNLYLGNNANNVFRNQVSNLEFCDSQPYEATIQLLDGHNDFYHQFSTSCDFTFDENYYDFPIIPDPTIDASKNWFEEEKVVINDAAYEDYVIVGMFDPEANMPPPPFDNDRISVAMGHEAQGEYETACEEYAAILNNPLASELRYLPIAADGVFRYAAMMTDQDWVTTQYFDDMAIQYEIDNPALSALLEEYLAKSFILNDDYQSAIDLIQQRIDEPANSIDSLLAVLDLEIVLQLADLEETKKPITTKYTQYKYPTIQVFNNKHDEHWTKLYELMDKGNGETGIPLPLIPHISSNYPNPFNPTTTITFSIPDKAKTKIAVYNLKGQKVKDILNGELPRGQHKAMWDGRDHNNRSVSSGFYFLRLESGGKASLRKVMLMKLETLCLNESSPLTAK